jgi:hypothetical protein
MYRREIVHNVLMDSVIYEDNPHYDVWLKALVVLPICFIAIAIYFLLTAQTESAIGLLATALLMGAVYWAVFPRKYQILDSKLRIVLGGQLAFNVPFDTLETAAKPGGIGLGINFATTFLSSHTVEIVRKKGMNVNITPGDRDLFLERLNKAVYDWKRNSDAHQTSNPINF